MNLRKYLPTIPILLVLAGVLYFALSSKEAKCQTENINWDIAIQALSKYYSDSDSSDFGPADIQRHFEENCAQDLKIYNDFLKSVSTRN